MRALLKFLMGYLLVSAVALVVIIMVSQNFVESPGKAMTRFFSLVAEEAYEDAYHLMSPDYRQRYAFKDFVDWARENQYHQVVSSRWGRVTNKENHQAVEGTLTFKEGQQTSVVGWVRLHNERLLVLYVQPKPN